MPKATIAVSSLRSGSSYVMMLIIFAYLRLMTSESSNWLPVKLLPPIRSRPAMIVALGLERGADVEGAG